MAVQRTFLTRGLLLAFLAFAFASPVRAASTIGLYTDSNGSSCSFSGNSAGPVTAYVVIKPDEQGIRGVRFSAPIPPCLGAVFLVETPPPGIQSIGSSETGVSVAFPSCAQTTTYALQIQYLRTSTTSCCEFTIAADPIVGMIEGVDCNFESRPMTPVVSHFNADVSCPCNDLTPPLPPESPVPNDGLTTVSVLTTFSWSPSPYDTDIENYDLYLGTDPAPAFVGTLTQPSYQPAQPLQELTQYYWRVVVRDDDGHTTSGPVWTFKTRALNSPPNPPTIVLPPTGAQSVSVVTPLQWFATDIDGDVLKYDVYLGPDPNTSLYVSGLTTNSYTITTPLAYSTTYRWYVVARDPFGHESASVSSTFTTRPSNYPPNAAATPLPTNNATGVAADATLSWHASDPDPGDVLTFDIYLGTSTPPPLVVTDHPSTNYAPVMSFATKYYWKIVTRDSHGAESTSPVWNFTTRIENYPPAAPSSPVPGSGATNVAINASLSWQCSDPDGEAIAYDVYLGTSTPPPLLASDVPVKSYTPGLLNLSKLYYWRIVARDARGAMTSGPTWTFATQPNHTPNSPSSPSPANTASNQPLQVHLAWTCTDSDPGQTLMYDMYFGTPLSPPLVASDLTAPQWDTPALAPGTAYWWYVEARDNLGATRTGSLWKFTTAATVPPGAPSNPIPPSGASMNATSVTLQWDAPPELTSFTINFGTSSSPPFAGTSSSHSFDPGPLVLGQTYYWNVSGSDGISPVTSPTWYFVVSGGSIPVLFSSFDGEVSGAGVRISWRLRSDETMQSYTLYRRGDAGAFAPIVTAPVSGPRGSFLDSGVESGRRYHYQLEVRTTGGDEFRSPTATVSMPVFDLTLGPNHPNPFNPQTTIPYFVPAGGTPVRVRLVIYDSAGGVVRVLVDENQSGGAREVVWNGSDESGATVTSGIYFCVLQAGKDRRTQKLVMLK